MHIFCRIGPYLRGPWGKTASHQPRANSPRAGKWAKNVPPIRASRVDRIPSNVEEKHPNYYSLHLLGAAATAAETINPCCLYIHIVCNVYARRHEAAAHHTKGEFVMCERAESAPLAQSEQERERERCRAEKFFQRIKNCTIHHPLLCRLRHVGVRLLAKWRKRVRREHKGEGRAARKS
jgi:hypothetical protein